MPSVCVNVQPGSDHPSMASISYCASLTRRPRGLRAILSPKLVQTPKYYYILLGSGYQTGPSDIGIHQEHRHEVCVFPQAHKSPSPGGVIS